MRMLVRVGRLSSLALPLAAGALAHVACFTSGPSGTSPVDASSPLDDAPSSTSSAPDGSPTGDIEDGGSQGKPDATTDSGGSDGGAPQDSGTEAATGLPAGHLFVFAIGGPGTAHLFSFSSGMWYGAGVDTNSLLEEQDTAKFPPGLTAGGGATFTGTGGGAAAFLDFATSQFTAATWTADAGWGQFKEPSDAGAALFTGQPTLTATGAIVAHELSSGAVLFDEFVGGSWTTSATPITGDQLGLPAVAEGSTPGDALLIAPTASGYDWSYRTSGTWSAPATIAGLALPPNETSGHLPGASIVRANAAGDLLAGFATSVPADGGPIEAIAVAKFSAGAWSAPTVLATDLNEAYYEAPRLAVLADGTIALAYFATSSVKVGFYDGASWSTFQVAPGVYPSLGFQPFDIARGASGALLELSFIDSNNNLFHVRLTDRASWTWTSVVTIDGNDRGYKWMQIIAGP